MIERYPYGSSNMYYFEEKKSNYYFKQLECNRNITEDIIEKTISKIFPIIQEERSFINNNLYNRGIIPQIDLGIDLNINSGELIAII